VSAPDNLPAAYATSQSTAQSCRPALFALSIDVEEYFQAEAFAEVLSPQQWPQMARRARPALELIAGLLDRFDRRATFFVLGWTVPYLAPLLKDLARKGHEIACHGYAHQHLARMTAASLQADLTRARKLLEDTVGVSPRGYRAPTFSLTRKTAWAVQVIASAGFEYDSSIFPVWHDRYGVPDAPVQPFWLQACGVRLLEFPPLTLRAGPLRVPVGGGGYLRLLPLSLLRWSLRRRAAQTQPALLYLHPWELDPDQPRIGSGGLASWRHRLNLRSTPAKLASLLQRFPFDTVWNVLQRVRQQNKLEVFTLCDSDGKASSSKSK
jgi:polysaccharide deacetylase family protein (PEP-CTERM system associated)